MQIKEVRVHHITLPFSMDFSHSLRKRRSANNIVVEVIAEGGRIRGYGEGAPRSYVTGESPHSATGCVVAFTQSDAFPWELREASQIWDFVDSLPEEKGNRSALCALETSLLDALGRKEGKPLTEYFDKDFYTDRIYYGGAIPLAPKERVEEICYRIKGKNIEQLKIKFDGNLERNRQALEAVRGVYGERCDLKVDINGVWDYENALRHVPIIEEFRVRVVEQPMGPHDPGIGPFARVMRERGVTLMADESACCLAEVEEIARDGHYGMVNMRLSKCGGFRKSLKMIEFLRSHEISFQIGCQLGESGVLSAAGRALSLLCSDALYHDGSYDAFLLKENLTCGHVSFGPGGEAGPLGGPGLGVEVSQGRLERISEPSSVVNVRRP